MPTRDSTSVATVSTTANMNWSHTVGAGSNRLLLVAVNVGDNDGDSNPGTVAVTAVKGGIDTVMLTDATNGKLATGAGDYGYEQIFYMLDPDVGSNAIKVTRTGGTGTIELRGGAVTYTGTGTPIFTKGSPGSSGGPATVTFTVASGDMAVTSHACGNDITGAGGGDSVLWDTGGGNANGAAHQLASERSGAFGSITMTATLATSDYWGSIGVRIPAPPTPVWRELLARSPLWLAKMNEPSGTLMIDSSGNSGRDGTIDAGVTLGATGIIPTSPGETCWDLNAFEGGQVAGASWMAPASAYTALVFFRLTAYDSDGTVLLARSEVNGSNTRALKCWAITVLNTGAVNSRVFSNANVSVVPASAAGEVALNTLYMLAIRYDGTDVKFYKNGGNQIATAALAGAPPTFANNAKPITVGKSHNLGGTSDVYTTTGKIHGAAFYGSALTTTDLDAIWAAAQVSSTEFEGWGVPV